MKNWEEINKILLGGPKRKEKKKRKTLTAGQRTFVWDHPKKYGRKCSICGSRITMLADLELDHTRAHSKGGKKLALAHKQCNRLKASGSLRTIQKRLGLKVTKKKKARRKKAAQLKGPYWVNPLTGKKRPLRF